MTTSGGSDACETPMSPGSSFPSSAYGGPGHRSTPSSSNGSTCGQIRVRDGRLAVVETKRQSSTTSDDTIDVPSIPRLPVDGSATEPATPTLQYASADTYPPMSTPPAGYSSSLQQQQQAAETFKKDNKSKSSLLASSRKAGSKVVKATVVRPARAVTRVFRGPRVSSDESNPMALRSSSSGIGEEVETIMARGIEGNQVLLHSAATANGVAVYGTMNGHGGQSDISPLNLGRGISVGSLHSNRSPVPDSAVAAAAATRSADWPVHSVEALTRQLVIVCVAYMVGANYPEYLHHVLRTTEFAVTAWMTCVAILFLSFLQRRFPHVVLSERDKYNLMVAAGAVVDDHEVVARAPSFETTHLLRSDLRVEQGPTQSNYASVDAVSMQDGLGAEYLVRLSDESPLGGHTLSQEDMSVTSQTMECPNLPKMEHPSLGLFYVVDANSGERVLCNSATPHHISNEWFEMDMLCLIRTCDADDSSAVSGTPANDKVSNYMRGKARRFEFQFRVKLKKTPVGKQVYFACELDEPIKMGVVTRAFVGAAMAFMKKTNPTFHYSITGSKETPDGKWEKPHMSFTVEGSLDRLVVTRPDEKPPKLGRAIYEAPESIKRRKKGVLTDWNTQDTYTMALWTSYVDFLDWNVLNLPGIRPFGLSSVLGTQSINLTMYLIDEKRDSDKHLRKDITEIIKLELSNELMAACGPAAMAWKESHAQGNITSGISQPCERNIRERSVSEDSAILSQELDAESTIVEDESATDFDLQFRNAQGTDEAMEDIEEVDEDVLTAAELGEGIYLRSGDSVILRELRSEFDTSPSCSIANGGGFAVLQERDVAIVIEKAKRSRKTKLIKSGDTVIFKMIQNKAGSDDVETKYLTIHRGWWLKWVTTIPTKNGFFTIFTHETELGDKAMPTNETQSSFLTLGGSFTLRHKRWSKYCVGIAAEPSTTYGGRMMGLYNPKSKISGSIDEEKHHTAYHSDEEFDLEKDVLSMGSAGWLKPLVLKAFESSAVLEPGGHRYSSRAKAVESGGDTPDLSFVSPATKLIFSCGHSKADVPAWIEMMDRVERARQLAYVVRVTRRSPHGESKFEENDEGVEVSPDEPDSNGSFMRLRTGRELAHVMSIGQSVRLPPYISKQTTSSGSFDAADDNEMLKEPEEPLSSVQTLVKVSKSEWDVTKSPLKRMLRQSSYTGGMTTNAMESRTDRLRRRMTADHAASLSFDEDDADDEFVSDSHRGGEHTDEYVMDECYVDDDSSLSDSGSSGDEQERKGALKKGKKLLGKSAKLAKKTVVGTGKLTAKTAKGTTKFAARTGKKTGKLASSVAKKSVEQSKKVVKGTVKTGVSITKTTGKVLIAPVTRKSSKPPKSEPKKKKDKEDHVEVSKRMKKLGKIEEKTARSPIFIAGELCAPEQSCRTASRVLSRMSNLTFMSPQWEKCNDVLSAEVEYLADHDQWFLNGNCVDLGVVPIKRDGTRGELLEESLVARCHWESHWREEWCGMYESCVSFYAPLAKLPCLEIAYMDITNVRPLESDAQSPLPGFPLLVLETAWLCHYIAFRDAEARDTFGEKLEHVIENHVKMVEETASLEQSALRKARFWQGFQTLSESSLSSGIGKWAKLRSKDKTMERAVLNGRRMAFDCRTTLLEDVSESGFFAKDLLTRVLSFSVESLENDPDSFIEFLDLTSQLRFLPIDEIDLSSKFAFCLFVNIYHCLMQQALLLSVNGPLTKKNITHFMHTSCYELGGDVFSLAELQCCVIRGKLSKPVAPKPPYIEPPKKSNAYRYYALGFTDCRVHFLLNTGDTACPASVPVLSPETVDQQLKESCAAFMDNNQLVVDTRRRTVTLPKVCEVYKHDFGGGDFLPILKFCVEGMDEDTRNFVRLLLMDEKNLIIKFQHTTDQYRSSLRLRKSVDNLEAEVDSVQEATSKGMGLEI